MHKKVGSESAVKSFAICNPSRLENLIFCVRDTGVSRHNGGQIEDRLKPVNTILLWCTGGFRGPQLGPHDADRS